MMISKEKFNKDIGKRIKEIRQQKGISLKDFESRDNAVDRSNLSKIESGRKAPTLYTLYKIALILEVDMQAFFKDRY
jgi:transcriptional regulator with XRE-family HTH domain